MPRQRHRLGRIANRRLAIEQLVNAVGRGGGPLQPAEDFRQLADRIAGAGQQAVKHQQPGQIQRPIAHADAEQVGLLIQHQIGAGQNGHADDEDAHHFDDRMDQRVVARDLHRFAKELLADFVKSAAFVAFHGERLDDFDAAERFVQDVVQLRHLFHRPAIGPLERFGKPADHETRPAARPAATAPAASSRSRPRRSGRRSSSAARGSPGRSRRHAAADAIHVVGEPAHQIAGAVLPKLGKSIRSVRR